MLVEDGNFACRQTRRAWHAIGCRYNTLLRLAGRHDTNPNVAVRIDAVPFTVREHECKGIIAPESDFVHSTNLRLCSHATIARTKPMERQRGYSCAGAAGSRCWSAAIVIAAMFIAPKLALRKLADSRSANPVAVIRWAAAAASIMRREHAVIGRAKITWRITVPHRTNPMISCAKTTQRPWQSNQRGTAPVGGSGAAIVAAVTVHSSCATIFCSASEIRGAFEEDIEGNMVKRKETKRRPSREARALDRLPDHARASHATGLPLAIPLPIPTYWTPEQAIAVFELIDDLRERIWSFYQSDLQEMTRQQREPDPVDPLEIDEDDLPFWKSASAWST
jgi:hypothetical protein